MPCRDDLHRYQHEAIDFIKDSADALMLCPMGAGKTVITATAIQDLLEQGAVRRALILAPKRPAQMTWPAEIAKWDHITFDYSVAIGTPKQRAGALMAETSAVVMNYENLLWLIDNYDINKLFDAIVFDEVTWMKNPSSKRFKKLKKYIPHFETRIGLTGTLGGEVPDVFAQVYVVDAGERLGKSKTAFDNEFMVRWGREPWQIKPAAGAEKKLAARIAPLVFEIDGADYEDQLPPLIENIIEVELPPNARRIYDELEQHFVADMGDDELLMTPTMAATLNKLQQIANGFYYTEGKPFPVHDAKADAMVEVLNGCDSLVGVYKYKFDIELMGNPPCINSSVSDAEVAAMINSWNNGELKYVAGHPMSFGHGLNLQKGGNVIAWFGHTYSMDEYAQTVARLRRQGQESGQVWSHLIVAKDTIDTDIIAVRRGKGEVEKMIVNSIRERNS